MPETFRESGDPEAAAVFEEGGRRREGTRGAVMACTCIRLLWSERDAIGWPFSSAAFAVPDYKSR